MKKVNMIFKEKKPSFWMALALVMMIGVLSLCVWPLFSRLSADQALWQDLMRHPLLAQGAMSAVMALQVVLAFLPGEPVELLCGYLFGTIGGMAVCVIGSMIGSALIFLLVRKLGEKAVLRMFPQEKVEELAFLKHKEKLVGLLFIIFLIPGTPKDILTYCIAADRYPLLLISAHHRSCAHPFHHHEHDGGIDVSHGRIWDHGGGAGDNGASVIGRTVAVPIHLCA